MTTELRCLFKIARPVDFIRSTQDSIAHTCWGRAGLGRSRPPVWHFVPRWCRTGCGTSGSSVWEQGGFCSAQEYLGRLGVIPKDKICCRAKGNTWKGAGAAPVSRCPSLGSHAGLNWWLPPKHSRRSLDFHPPQILCCRKSRAAFPQSVSTLYSTGPNVLP